MSYKRKTCICGHNKKTHGYYFGCKRTRCGCLGFQRKRKGVK